MSLRHNTFRRAENVLDRDTIGAPLDGLDAIRRDIELTLQNYMDIDAVHITLKRGLAGEYTLRIDGKAKNIRMPHIAK